MRIACFAESYNFKFKQERQALEIFKRTAEELGHSFTILGKEILQRIDDFDSVFIRATTDPLFTSYIVSRLAEEMGKKVIDDSESIRICSNKVALYYRLKKSSVPTPKTIPFFGDFENLESYAEELGYPVVVKRPNSRFSLYVEKANNYYELIKVVKKYMRRSKALILQEYVPTAFDWRIGVLGREVIYACKYFMPKGGWKITDYIGGKKVWGNVKAVRVENLPSKLRKIAVMAAKSVGNGLYGVDVKEINGNYYVIEVNDNPTIMHGDEDAKNPELYEKIILALTS
ncbi:RimK domain protein ATP-grasp [Ferroglobus placidus DSM 10642]|uniref:RimK domain protein ATP-grasp n=1 Tax=Ferroglobus placidus (strain DSM 10642 / AEDII12DO) TaxID=589924 RepID=D3S0Q6_FERPA|nr:RimK family alpha-L-glutamate ligase [Ferroglobus placidus]ADC66297.1 RimK domain protein ATP-grasp [Ferroglobus placidus DSM 10642]